jgi:hypothetical protein
MTDRKEATADDPEHTPNFELPRHGAIREDNWPEHQAAGFQPIWNSDGSARSFGFAQMLYGTEHVYTGDAYDDGERRPLRHKPGVGLYTDPDGVTFHAEKKRKREDYWREREARQRASEGGPGSN